MLVRNAIVVSMSVENVPVFNYIYLIKIKNWNVTIS